jgi:DNA polymerase I-like protein with 3'-5' exonuclease and polymerase domains
VPRFKRYKYDAWAAVMFACYTNDAPKVVAIDTETSGVAWDDAAFCVTISWRSPYGAMRSAYIDLEDDESGTRREMIRQMLKLAQTWVFHNCKFDLQKLELNGVLREGWNGRTIEDTQIIYSLINENDRKGLKYLAAKILGEETNEDEVLKVVRRKLKLKKDDGYHLLPREVVAPYAMKDTEFTLRLYETLYPQLADDLIDLYRFMIDFELALLQIEGHGIGIDVGYLAKAKSEYGVRVLKGEQELNRMARDETGIEGKFNPNSPKQIQEAFEARTGKRPESTDRATLEKMDDPFAEALLQYRSDKKMHSTYLVPMLAEQRDGVLHPNFNTSLPRTGRMSSSAASNH